jgi:hypothetical protein
VHELHRVGVLSVLIHPKFKLPNVSKFFNFQSIFFVDSPFEDMFIDAS